MSCSVCLDIEQYKIILNEINELVGFNDCIIIGDFNTSYKRSSGRCNFLESEEFPFDQVWKKKKRKNYD
jgi:hypothetical protein